MTVIEFSNEFDILYDNLATKGSPGLDKYEKSVFLTKAQLEVAKNKYEPLGNKYKKGFESNEKRRVDLDELVKNYRTTTTIPSSNTIGSNSTVFKLPDDMFVSLFEEVSIKTASKSCLVGTYQEVKPKTHDEYTNQLKNPFKNPDEKIAWRLNLASEDGNKLAEIISNYELNEYHIRYLKLPPPIILVNLTTEFVGEGLTIQGETVEQTCILDDSVQPEILDRAVQLAIAYYKEASLKTIVQLNERNE